VAELPNYLSNLNACHDMEKALSPSQWPKYVTFLRGITSDRAGEGLVFATAAQRCEAFLRTINLWTP